MKLVESLARVNASPRRPSSAQGCTGCPKRVFPSNRRRHPAPNSHSSATVRAGSGSVADTIGSIDAALKQRRPQLEQLVKG